MRRSYTSKVHLPVEKEFRKTPIGFVLKCLQQGEEVITLKVS